MIDTPTERANWSGNVAFRPQRFHEPDSIASLQSIVASAKAVRVVGAGHSFNDIVDTRDDLISLGRLNRVLSIDEEARTVTAEAGIRYFELCAALQANGWALHNLPSVPHFNVVGACATATHGSGDTNGGLATAIRSIDLVTAGGDLVRLDADHDDFGAIVVGLGAFGIVARVTLAIEPSYRVAQELHLNLPQASAIERLDQIMASAYSVSYFTTWKTDRIESLWRKHRLDGPDGEPPTTPAEFHGATRSSQNQDPRGELGVVRYTEQLMVPGPWSHRLPHVKPEFPSNSGDELQSEYFVPRRFGPDALRAVARLGDHMAPATFMSEIRTVRGDDFWLSPFPDDSLCLHFSWVNDVDGALRVLPRLESALEPFGVRPHWGKLYSFSPEEVRDRYARFADFVALADRYDPAGKFRNDHLRTLFG